MQRAAWLLAVACATQAAAQDQPQITLAPSPTQRCLSPALDERGEPDYPYSAYKRGEKGRVKVELTFSVVDRRPAVKVLESEGGDEFVDAVHAHVRKLRTPCLEAGEAPAKLVQEYVFVPDQRTSTWHYWEPEDASRSALLKCMAPVNGKRTPPPYPPDALRAGVQGRVLVEMNFANGTDAPEVKAHALRHARMLTDPTEQWVKAMRLPCHEGPPLRAVLTFIYKFEGDPAYGFGRISFLEYLGSIKNIRKQRVQYDMQTMACPFDLRIQYRQPFLLNAIGEVGRAHPGRAGLIEWLARSELALGPRQSAAVFGDHVTLTVPCIQLDLKPTE